MALEAKSFLPKKLKEYHALHNNLPLKISDLSQSLNEALHSENYEEAAMIRDQIQTLLNQEGEDK